MARQSYTSRDHASFVCRYAKQAGISQRSAQRHRRESAPAWLAFVAKLKSQTPSPIPPAPPPMGDEFERIEPADVTPENMPDAILGMWHDAHRRWWKAVADGDAMAQVDLDGALRGLAKAWRNAVKSKEKHDQFVKNHVPASEIAATLDGFFRPLESALATLPAEAGPLVNPHDPAAGRAGCMEWRESRLLPALERVFEKLADYVPRGTAA